MSVQQEAQYSKPIEDFVTLFNRRVVPRRPLPSGQVWVRVRPPSMEEAMQVREHPWYLPFVRVGSIGHVVEDSAGFIDLCIGGDRVLIESETFFSTWVRAVDPKEWQSVVC